MVATVTINPLLTTNAAGSFNISNFGLIVGTAYNDPAIRYQLAGGYLSPNETLPMWGGVAISEGIPGAANTPNNNLGGVITRATNVTSGSTANYLTGFSVFDQNYAAINSPQSPVPLTPSYGLVNFYRLGSLARIAVACDPGLASLEGDPITQAVSWDFTAQELVAFTPAYNNVTISNAVWASTNGGQTTFTVGTNLTAVLAAGSTIDVTGVVNTGGAGGATNVFNGTWDVVSVTSGTVVVAQLASVSPGTYASGGTILAAGGALNVKVLDFNIGNSMTVVYNAATGFATWNRSGNAAIILL